jgi:hypothetical protein
LHLGGTILNSHFEIALSDHDDADLLIILSSRGGTGEKARNPDYAKQLARILLNLQTRNCTIIRVDLLSTVAIKSLVNLALDLPCPIDLNGEIPIEEVRKMIQNAQLVKGQKPGASGGNSTKRIGIHVKTGPLIAIAGMRAVLDDLSA